MSIEIHTSIAENAYLAGIVDGEGSIRVRYAKDVGPNGVFRCELTVSNTNMDLISMLIHKYGGSIAAVNPTCRQWRMTGQKALPILKSILPYLIVKRRHCELAIEYLENCVCGSGNKLTSAQVMRAQQITEESGILQTKYRRGLYSGA
jgi:hypothetical protein